MMLSEVDLEDVEALHLGPSFLTADTLGPLLDHCEDALLGLSSLEEAPPSQPLSPSSPVHFNHASPSEAKGSDLMLPWFGAGDLLDIQCPQEEDDALLAMEWVSEKLELGDLDLDSLLDSSDDCPESPEAQLDLWSSGNSMEPEPHQTTEEAVSAELPLVTEEAVSAELPLVTEEAVSAELPLVTEEAVSAELPLVTEEAVSSELPLIPEEAVKCEPLSPVHSLELGSEVDLLEKTSRPQSDCDSDSGIESSPPHTPQSCRSKPYSRPQLNSKPPRAKAPKSVDKKLKKMEQNKTAATRYRHKKRVEQEELSTELLQLEQKNQELKDKAQAISREIQYLQDLMEEVRRHHQNKRGTAAK